MIYNADYSLRIGCSIQDISKIYIHVAHLVVNYRTILYSLCDNYTFVFYPEDIILSTLV